MAYREDKDLEFLKSLERTDLRDLAFVLTKDEKAGKKLANFKSNEDEEYKKYLHDLLEELQRDGGNTFVNLLRGGKGVLYKEILCEVCEKFKVKFDENSSAEVIEEALIKKLFREAIEKMSEQERQELIKDLDIKTTDTSASGIISALQQGIFFSQMAFIVANAIWKAIFNTALSMGANATLARAAAILAGPIGMAITGLWTAIDIAGPAYRITIPAVIQIALLRQAYNEKQEKLKTMEKDPDSRIKDMFNQKLGILIVGGTGVGKSSTINALFERENGGKIVEQNAKVGGGGDPITQEIAKYELGNFTIYDSPGLGDSTENDKKHAEKIKELLLSKDDIKDEAKIDLVLLIGNCSAGRDLESSYKLLREVLIPYFDKDRILVAMNKCDKASDEIDENFDYVKNEPSKELVEYLEKYTKGIKERIKKENDGVDVEVIYYSAGSYSEKKQKKQPAYNLNKLLYYIVKKTPIKKRLVYKTYIADDSKDYQKGDNQKDYNKEVEKSWWETVKYWAEQAGEKIGDVIDWVKSEAGQKTISAVTEAAKKIYSFFSKGAK